MNMFILLDIPNLLILITNTFTEYSQDEYGLQCKHPPMNVFMSPLSL